MADQQQDQEVEVEPYTVKIMSPDDLDLFLNAHTQLTELLKQKIDEFSRATTRREEKKVTISEFQNIVDGIKTILAGSMSAKVHRLCDLLSDSIYLDKIDTPRLQDGIKVLKELEESVEQLSTLIALLRVPNHYQFFRNYEGGEEGLKRYKSARIQSKLIDLFSNLNNLLQTCSDLLPIPGHRTVTTSEAKRRLRRLIAYVEGDEKSEEDLIKWFDRSELCIVQDHLRDMTDRLEGLFEELFDFLTVHTATNAQPLLEFIPILKLSRLFFNKISKPTSEQSHPISHMCLEQLLALINVTASIPTQLTKFYDQIEANYRPLHNVDLRRPIDLNALFQAPINLITKPLLNPQHTYPNLPQDLRKQFIQWYAIWQSHFSLAVQRFHNTFYDAFSAFVN
ncbi:hypothetical protein PGT21_016624 [Puccinia graminis f. sp. tritici]|uniref:Uncharacterized protein n=1 Tax=Puccinia graminis f. sp. tritici TaxID=56615 RepID=A0A5B0NM07_PUCGR|nr:hypothetical protein PGT21_016624 [Puccinia graminis f. sp. tritici]KAA1089823.1 hypothetical protein PGTUg99_020208 [Puccinia graminis f. sp. tritici]